MNSMKGVPRVIIVLWQQCLPSMNYSRLWQSQEPIQAICSKKKKPKSCIQLWRTLLFRRDIYWNSENRQSIYFKLAILKRLITRKKQQGNKGYKMSKQLGSKKLLSPKAGAAAWATIPQHQPLRKCQMNQLSYRIELLALPVSKTVLIVPYLCLC